MKKIGLIFLTLFAIFGMVSCSGNRGNDPEPEPTPEVTYTVTYDNNGHGTTPASLTGVTVLPSNLPVLSESGWNFEGWYYDSSFNTMACGGDNITANITLYAKWSEVVVKYSISYDANGHGSAPAGVSDVTALPGTLPTILAEGYAFGGWYYDAACTQEAKANDSLTSNVTLYAKWTEVVQPAPTYTVTYVTEYGTKPVDVIGVTTLPATLPVLEALGYVFGGWYYDATLIEVAIAGSTITVNTTLYAKWTEVVQPAPTYTVTYVTEYGTKPVDVIGVTTLPETLPVLEALGYVFGGWYIDQACTTVATAGAAITTNTTLYAKWDLIKFTITFDSNGGSEVESQKVELYGLITEPTAPTKDGYTFDGWYKDEACTIFWQFALHEVESDMTLYAKWLENSGSNPEPEPTPEPNPNPEPVVTYTLTYNVNGQGITPTLVSGITVLPELPVLNVSGYTFGGWYYDALCTAGNEALAGDTLTADTVLYAKWTQNGPNEFTVSFTSGGGTLVSPQTVSANGLVTKPTDPTKSGYKFVGWYSDSTLETAWDFANNKVTESITLYAKWEAKTKYDELVEQTDLLVINDDFNSRVTTEKLNRTDEITNPFVWDGKLGFYEYMSTKSTTAVGTASTNYVKFNGTNAELVDSTDDGTQLIVSFGEEKTSGELEGYLEVTFITPGNSWTPVQIVDGTGTEIFGIRIDGGLLKYRLAAGTATAAQSSITSADGTTYKIHYKINIDEQKMTMTINEQAFVTDLSVAMTSIGGIRLTSSDTGSKRLSVDNIAVIYENLSLEEYKELYVAKLNTKYASYDVENNYATIKTQLEGLKSTGTANINAASTKMAVKSAYEAIVASFEEAILNSIKTEYKNQLNSFDKSGYTVNLEALNQAITNGISAINAANSVTEVYSAYEEAMQVINAIENDEEALSTSKTNAITQLYAYRSEEGFTINASSYNEAVSSGVAQINQATSHSAIEEVLESALAAIDLIKSDAEFLAEEKVSALAELEAYKTSALEDLNSTEHSSFITQINDAYNAGVAAINSSLTVTQVQSALANAKASINTIHSAATMSLSELKTTALAELEAYATSKKNEYNSTSLSTDIDVVVTTYSTTINNSTTNEAVLSAVSAGKAEIDTIVSAYESSGGNEIVKQGEVVITSFGGTEESAYIYFDVLATASDYKVYAKGPNYSSYTLLTADNIYISAPTANTRRIDLLGLAKGEYLIKIVPVINNIENESLSSVCRVTVTNYDRSGYAHFNYNEGVGAYNNDGTLKENALVIYVTDENKNTVSVTQGGVTVTGIGNILNSVGAADPITGLNSKGGTPNTNQYILKLLADANVPLVVRFVGTVSNSGLYESASNNPNKAPLIEGLTHYDGIVNGGTAGDNGHMARMSSGKNITLEGIGDGAIIDGWGFHFICHTDDYAAGRGRNFEVRNLKFINVPEDCVGMEGQQEGSTLTAPVERCWVHNCEFIAPAISSPAESDKDGGDGACDFKRGNYFTNSYCYYNGYHKTNLVGSSDDSLQYHLTYHHNYWKNCESRGPLARNANIHMYNNVFAGQSSYAMNPRANAYIFSEYNLFLMTKNPMQIRSGGIKSYNDMFVSITGDSQGTIVTDKSQTVNTSNVYANFDTNSELSYIPDDDYIYETDLTQLRKILYAKCGVRKVNIEIENVTMSDISIISNTATINKVTGPTTLVPGKSKAIYAFEIDSYYTVKYTNAGTYAGLLCNEAGILVSDGSEEVVLAPGRYMLISSVVDTGSAASDTIIGYAFKEFNVTELTFTAYDSEELNAQRIAAYNTAVANIPSTITYTDNCYNAIKVAQDSYNSLGDLKSQVNYTPVQTAYNTYISLGKTEVESKINAIGTVDANSGSAISSARAAYDKLKSIDSSIVISNYSTLTAAEVAFGSYAVTSFKNKVNAIGTVSLTSGDAINMALNEYNGLTSTQQTEVATEYATLLAAQAEYNKLVHVDEFKQTLDSVNTSNIDSLSEVINSYNALTTDEVAMLDSTTLASYSTVKVQYTIALIDAIGTVSANSGNAITAAEDAYNGLSTSEQALVTNYQTLVDAKAAFEESLAGQYSITFANSAPVGDTTFFTVSGEYKNKVALKLQSSAGSVAFTTTGPATLVITFASSSDATTVKVNGTEYNISAGVATITLASAGTYTITRGQKEAHISQITVTQ